MVQPNSQRPTFAAALTFWLAVITLLAVFWLAFSGLRAESLWNDEAWSAWAVRSPYLADMLARVRSDVHPPLYFALLDAWTLVAGESVLALRWPSLACALLATAATYALGRRLFDRATGLFALLILGTSAFWLYYAREARMYTLLMLLGALATLLYLRWRERPGLWRALAYALTGAALLYTHYAGALILLTHMGHTLCMALWPHPHKPVRGQSRNILCVSLRLCGEFLVPYLLMLVLFVPWLGVLLDQMRANPSGPLALPVPTDWGTVAALLLILTGGYPLLTLLPLALAVGVWLWDRRAMRRSNALLLITLWLLLTPLMLLALNALFAPVYQVRYVIAALPAWALLLAAALRGVVVPTSKRQPHTGDHTLWQDSGHGSSVSLQMRSPLPSVVNTFLPLALLAALVYTQLSTFTQIWPGKPAWQPAVQQVIDARTPLQPLITDFAPYSPAAYYDHQLGIRRGITLDLSWRLHNAQESRQIISHFDAEPSVWVMLPVNTAKTWHILAELDRTRHVGYRASLVNMLFYRFDQGDTDDLAFRFGETLSLEAAPTAEQQFTIRPGDELCADLRLRALTDLDGSLSAGLHLVDWTGSIVAAQWDEGLGTAPRDSYIERTACMDIPAEATPGYYHLQLVIYEWATLRRLPLLENGAGTQLAWGDALMLAAVDIAGSE
ncbi:MAG: glycosyltransferase family 39 protein [Anaerolineae bacterium]|nr:glycosyltransferase family 39 protein [Anaerolineae bacterium]